MSYLLLEILTEKALKGNKPLSTFKFECFVRAAKEISQKYVVDCLPGHVDNHLKTVKKEWTLITTIRAKSGFGWDDNLKMITAQKNVYDEEVLTHPTHEKYLNKKIEMYDEMQLVVGKDIATGLHAKSFIDVDSASTEMDSHPVDDIAEKETSKSSAPSKRKRSHQKKKERSSDANVDDDDNGIKELAIQVREIAKAMKDMSKQQLNVGTLGRSYENGSFSSPGALTLPRFSRRRNSLLSRRKIKKPLTSSSISPCVCLHVSTDTVAEIAQNKVLVGAFLSAVIGQVSKPFTSVLLYGNKFEFDFSWITRSGGFPSAHSSAVVATATSLGLERGFADSIFGLAVVYAGIVMYDAQGVRREVGNQAKVINKLSLKTRGNTCPSNDAYHMSESSSGKQSLSLERPDALLQEPSPTKPRNNTSLLSRIDDRTNQTMSTKTPSDLATDVKEGSGDFVHYYAPLKESVGHSEIEVLAGAILGFLVSLIIHTT
ncbi:hypothetical protein POM88_042897 [Heracleum sosnowskyi]|uniref:Myb/SANT-like domain-containing protein n=1 Tax=Heracleum sosnowskyi TaxID=360622 RepID=A0AAD8MB24_9APIA|nr:hypothetical protein POM88_042897 [Heracleum sosnowskyi]